MTQCIYWQECHNEARPDRMTCLEHMAKFGPQQHSPKTIPEIQQTLRQWAAEKRGVKTL